MRSFAIDEPGSPVRALYATLGQYNLVLLSFKWNWVSTRFLCLCILKQVEIWSDVTIAGRTNEQGKIESLRANGPWTAGMSIKEETVCRKKNLNTYCEYVRV